MRPPPFRRIADALRSRIEAGALSPGDRVPSTRELAAEHGVALATAAHALRVLTREGVVRPIPRIGTVVAARPSPKPRETDLGRDLIVDAAIAVADAEGLAALSLRGVASRLGAPVMSLYRHVSNKDELLFLMTDRALGEVPLPELRPKGWRQAIEIAARCSWATSRRHPWLVRTLPLTRPQPHPNAIRYADWVLGALGELGLDAATRMRLHILLHGFLQGLAINLEAEAEALGATGVTPDQWIDARLSAFEQLAATGRYPAFAAVLDELDEGFHLDLDVVFEEGLAALLDGIQNTLGGGRGSVDAASGGGCEL